MCSVQIWYMGTKSARKCNNDVRVYTQRSSGTGRTDTKAGRALRRKRFKPCSSPWTDPLNWHTGDGHTLRERKHEWREESANSRKFQRMAVERMRSCESV